MFHKNRRIKRLEFLDIVKKGRRYNSPHLLVYILKPDESMAKNSRFSFSVAKKVSKSAVGRNKLRRQGYSIINKYLNKTKVGYLVFFSFKSGSEQLSFSNLEQEIVELLSTSGVLL